MKVFMTAYACEPEIGSEPGVGWGWSNGLAQHVDLTVVTRGNNKGPIEDYYRGHPPTGGRRKPRWRPFVEVQFIKTADHSWRHFLDLAYWNVELK